MLYQKEGIAIEIERCIHSEQQHLTGSNFSVNIRYIENETRLNWKWYGTMTIDQHYCSDTVTEHWISRILREWIKKSKTLTHLAWNMLRVLHHCKEWDIIARIKQIFFRENLIFRFHSFSSFDSFSNAHDDKWWENIFISLCSWNDFNIACNQPWPCYMCSHNCI